MRFPARTCRLWLIVFLGCCLFCSCKKETDVTVETLLQQGLDSARSGKWRDALKFTLQAYEKNPGDISVQILHGLALENNGMNDEALAMLLRASADHKSFAAQYSYGRLLYQSGKYEQALTPLKHALELRPDDENTLILLEQVSARLNRDENRTYVTQLWKQFPKDFNNGSNPYVPNELGLYFAQRKQPKNAVASFLAAEKISPDMPEIQMNLAVVYDYQLEDRTNAIVHYEKYLRLTANQSTLEAERLAVSRRLQEIR